MAKSRYLVHYEGGGLIATCRSRSAAFAKAVRQSMPCTVTHVAPDGTAALLDDDEEWQVARENYLSSND